MKINELTDEKLSELLMGLDDDIEVPEDAGRAWRAAIKRETRTTRITSISRRLSALAAAVALVIGASIFFRSSGVIAKNAQNEMSVARSVPAASHEYVAFEADGEETAAFGMEDVVVFDEAAPLMSRMASPSGEVASVMAAAETKETEAPVDDLSGFVVNAGCAFKAETSEKANDSVTTALNEVDGYACSVEMTKDSYTAELRVNKQDLSRFTSKLNELTTDFTVKIETVPEAELKFDAEARLSVAYETEAKLRAQMNEADGSAASGIYDELKKVYAEIEELEAAVSRYANNAVYAHVCVNAEIGGFGTRLSSAISGFLNGFGSDMLITFIILLPGIAIIAAAALLVIKRKK